MRFWILFAALFALPAILFWRSQSRSWCVSWIHETGAGSIGGSSCFRDRKEADAFSQFLGAQGQTYFRLQEFK